MKYSILSLFILFSLNAFSIIAHDDRFYIQGTKWAELLNGIVRVNSCTGFLIEGDIIVSVAHCFHKDSDLDEDPEMRTISVITKDSKIDYKKLKKVEVRFGDANFDESDETKKTHFDKRSEVYRIKDLFLAHNPLKSHSSFENAAHLRDYALIKLEKPIPKNIKRFKVFHSDLLKDYEILRHPKGDLSTAGYHGDTTKTRFQRMAHLGCKVRDLRQYKKMWLESSDCDVIGGASGSALFYILRHKKTKKIELAAKSIAVTQGFLFTESRYSDDYEDSWDDKKQDYVRKYFSTRYKLGYGGHYLVSYARLSATGSISINNHKEFLTNLKKFKNNPSFYRNKKIPELEKNKYLDEKWLLKNIIQKKSLKELKDFVYKELAPIVIENSSFEYVPAHVLEKISKNKKYKIHPDKRKFLLKAFDYFYENNYFSAQSKYVRKFYPFKKRAKLFSLDKIKELEFFRHVFEDSVNDKEKAKKLWKMYFGK